MNGQPSNTLNITDKGSGALFTHEPDEPNPQAPAMTGNVEINAIKFTVAGFLKTAKESGKRYLSLVVSPPLPEGYTEADIAVQPHYNGKLFRREPDPVTGKANPKAPDYFGFVTVLPVRQGETYTADEWESAPTLRVVGWRRRSANTQARIVLTVAPLEVAADELPI